MTIKAGVIGFPISHSLSPTIHNFWLKKYDINGTYEAIEVKDNELEKFLHKDLIEQKFVGVNVTLPHKEKALELVDEVLHPSQSIGAINTIVVREGKIFGENTDFDGFVKAVGIHSAFDYEGKAVLLGAGGASRAILYALCLLGAGKLKIVIVNRTRERAENLKSYMIEKIIKESQEFQKQHGAPLASEDILGDMITVADWESRNEVLENAEILINTTSLGMVGQPLLDLDITLLPTEATVMDIVYRPLETSLLKSAKERGNITVDGLWMLLYQAVQGFHLWFGKRPDVSRELRQSVEEALE